MLRKNWPVAVLIIFIAMVIGLWLSLRSTYSRAAKIGCQLKIEQQCIDLEVSDSEAEREQGLSGRQSLGSGQGMLFDFGKTQLACMWMKDMNFAIDIVWLNKSKEIIKIEETVTPETYPNSFCAKNTRYVIELAPGMANNLQLGQQLMF